MGDVGALTRSARRDAGLSQADFAAAAGTTQSAVASDPRGAPTGLPFAWSAATLRAGLNFTLSTSIGAIHLLGEIAGGGDYARLLPHTQQVTLFEREFLLLNLPWLIHVKRAAGRPKDFEVIAELEASQEEIDGTVS